MKKILFLLLTYDEKNSNLYGDMVNEFANNGHEVYVATVNERKNNEKTYLFDVKKKLKVLKIKTGNLFGVNFIEKGITTISLGCFFKNSIKKYWGDVKFDLIISPTPPITFTSVIKFVKKRDNCKSYLILRDIFPQNAKDLGIIKNEFLFNFFRKKEEKLYVISDFIGCMSQENIEFIKRQNKKVNINKFHILRNWGKPLEMEFNENIREKYNFKNSDFLIVFGGNMGKPQGLEFLLELAKRKSNDNKIKFILVGKGNERDKLEEIKIKENLHNVIFLNYIPREEYESFVSSCNIGIVSLHSNFTIPNIPSKTVDYCKLGLPILASIDNNTDYGYILENEAKAGLFCLYGDINKYEEKLDLLINDENLRNELSRNGKAYFEKYLTVKNAYETIIKEVEKGERNV